MQPLQIFSIGEGVYMFPSKVLILFDLQFEIDKPIKPQNRHTLGSGCLAFVHPMQLTKESQSRHSILPLSPGSQSGITKKLRHIPCCMCKISCRLILTFGSGSGHSNQYLAWIKIGYDFFYIVCIRKGLKYKEIQTDDTFKRHCGFIYSQ